MNDQNEQNQPVDSQHATPTGQAEPHESHGENAPPTDKKKQKFNRPNKGKRPGSKRPFWAKSLSEEHYKLTLQIAADLKEETHGARGQISRIITLMGEEYAVNIAKKSVEIEQNGGMMTLLGNRKRTLGGIFFYHVRQDVKGTEFLSEIFPPLIWKTKKSSTPETNEKGEELPTFVFEERGDIIAKLGDGAALGNAKALLRGSIVDYEEGTTYVRLNMRYSGKAPTFPRGLPVPSLSESVFEVYVKPSHWQNVKSYATNPEDAVIVEGTCVSKPDGSGVRLYCTNISTLQILKNKHAPSQEG